MPKDQIREEIKSLEQVIYQDCFENFYHLILEGKIELVSSHLKKIYVGYLTIKTVPPLDTKSKKHLSKLRC